MTGPITIFERFFHTKSLFLNNHITTYSNCRWLFVIVANKAASSQRNNNVNKTHTMLRKKEIFDSDGGENLDSQYVMSNHLAFSIIESC